MLYVGHKVQYIVCLAHKIEETCQKPVSFASQPVPMKSILRKPAPKVAVVAKGEKVPNIDGIKAFQNWVPKGGLALEKEEETTYRAG